MLPDLRRAFLALLLVAAPAWGQDSMPWEGRPLEASPSEVLEAIDGLPESTDDEVDYLYWHSELVLDDGDRVERRRHQIYRILSAASVENWSVVEAAWSPWHQERPVIRARVITPTGRVHHLEEATIDDSPTRESSNILFSDARVLRAPLPALAAGAVVEIETIVREKAPLFAAGTVHQESLFLFAKLRHARIVLETPADRPVPTRVELLAGAKETSETRNGRLRRAWELRDFQPRLELEQGMPLDEPWFPRVAFATGESWAAVARDYSATVDRAIAGADVSRFVDQARAGASAQTEVIDRLLALLQDEVRYTGIEFGEASIVPRPPAQTLERRFGDCKDKATLLVAMLRAAEIPAYVALLRAGTPEDVPDDLPGLGGFNHAIVYVPAAPAIWIDPTSDFSRAGELPVSDAGRLALIASPSSTGLRRTPDPEPDDHRVTEIREFHLADLGPSRVIETTLFQGAAELRGRTNLGQLDQEDLRETLADYTEAAYLSREITRAQTSDGRDLREPFRLVLEVEEVERGQTDLDSAVVAIRYEGLVERLPEELQQGFSTPRKWDYVLGEPFITEWKYRIVPPAGYVLRELPESRDETYGGATLRQEFRQAESGEVLATFSFDTGPARMTAAQAEGMAAGVQELLVAEPLLLWFDHEASGLVADGRGIEALKKSLELVDRDADNALHRVHLARTLLTLGMGEAARAEANRAIVKDPNLAIAHQALGWVRMHDSIGRYLRDGYDRSGALEALERGSALNPTDEIARGNRAILLEHNEAAERYAAGTDLAGAVDAYRSIREDLESAQFNGNILVNLLRLERFDEIRQEVADHGASNQGQVFLASAIAATDGPEKAAQHLRRNLSGDDVRSQALGQSAQHMILLRRYPEAAALLRAAAQRSDRASVFLSLAAVLERTERWETLEPDPSRPEDLFTRLMLLLFDPDQGAEDLAGLITRRAFDGQPAEEAFAELDPLRDELRGRFAADAVTPDVGLDLGLAAIQPTVEGDAERGYRIRHSDRGFGKVTGFTLFAVREDERLKILGMEGGLQPAGDLVLELVDRGELQRAKGWLDWLREELGAPRGEDPYDPRSFARLWGTDAPAEPELMRRAAAVLIAQESRKEVAGLADSPDGRERFSQDQSLPKALTILEGAVGGEAGSTVEAFQSGLLAARLALGRTDEALDTVRAMVASHPTSEVAFVELAYLLSQQSRWSELEEFSGARLEALPGDLLALRGLAEATLEQGRREEGLAMLERVLGTGKASSGDYNNAAWMRLCVVAADDRALELAQQGAASQDHSSSGALHTLATIYAERDEPQQAYQVAIQAIEAADGEIRPHDWYVFGRMAESYGLLDQARTYYGRVQSTADTEYSVCSAERMAQNRLAALDDSKNR